MELEDKMESNFNLETPIKLNKQYRFQWEEAQKSYVLLYPEGLIKLQGSAGEILQKVNGEKTTNKIIQELEKKFPGADLKKDVIEFLIHANQKGWVDLE